MVKFFIYVASSLIILLAIYLSVFEFLLYFFQTSFQGEIKNPLAHSRTWTYLLKQEYVTFIELDVFNIHEKRHLLDVKRVFEKVYTLWIIFFSLSVLILTLFLFQMKEQLKKLLQHIAILGMIFNTFLIVFFLNFLNAFKLLHTFIFADNTWTFPKNSLLIEWFPLLYFKEFFLLFLFFTFIILFLVNPKKHLPHHQKSK
ncbi:MAG: Unknown protein [uncultured Sulfurovum sp.]|uniref:Integral membrane protein n=1 Tax=uncultured Sulfurovum sp. TaxID=269237 RepID=A0A6S6TI34_9BACT|nr:MAG: Unknown protein [uncultured Sulfurovum sp.]